MPAAGPEKSSHVAGNAAHGLTAGAALNQDQLRLEGEIFLSDWKI